jgi:ABC-2 type transport system ATP-binding protein
MHAVERFCDRAMLLDKGKLLGLGEPATIARRYNELNFGRTIHELTEGEEAPDEPSRAAYRDADILDGWFEDASGARVTSLAHRDQGFACFEVHFNTQLEDPIFGVTLRNDVGATVFATTTTYEYGDTGAFPAGTSAIVRLRFDAWLTRTSYTLTPSIARAGTGADAIDVRPDLAALVIHGGQFTTGVVDLPHAFEIAPR